MEHKQVIKEELNLYEEVAEQYNKIIKYSNATGSESTLNMIYKRVSERLNKE